ncbi:type VI secretion system baseplate subunit TssK [Sphingomonas morindae]|uniref:Type VI secretion system baseplate subunit TssK n=1 Tax=Sphingomonas morindae TaxID=1541170 RepID=A0ABY4XD66_9SPHN|nr:type VI secretion system baseplate subunit TssK [Sphingomonas morindae]USI74911.1 type VI secretion system baseplate subunit TssK [Sphingomonas morindae]
MVGDARVAWREGQFLRQQHFQQQQRHGDAMLAAQARAAGPWRWGVIELAINQDLAALGKFAVDRLVGIMPDGLVFAIPGDAPPPAPLDMAGDSRDALVQLTLPAIQPGAVEYRERDDPGAAAVRYVVEEEAVIDGFAEERTAEPIELARPNLRFGVTPDQTYGRVLLGLARVRETRNGALLFDERYIPPALDIRASPRLAGFLADIIGRATQRIEELARRAVEATDGGAESFANFLLLQALNRWTPQLEHLARLPMVHPERLFEALLGMAGELATLTTAERRPPRLPAYDHGQLRESFEPVVEVIQAALSAVYDRAAVQLPLKQAGPGAYTARNTDPALYQTGYFYLAVRARLSLDEVRARFPSVAKIGSVQKMRQIVESALEGVPLRHVPTPPPQIRSLPGHVYFELDRAAADWAELAAAPALGLHVAGDWPDLALELWCVRKAGGR